MVIEQTTASLVSHRESATQRGTTPHRVDASTVLSASDGGMESLRILKRRLSDVVYRAMLVDQADPLAGAAWYGRFVLPVSVLLDEIARAGSVNVLP